MPGAEQGRRQDRPKPSYAFPARRPSWRVSRDKQMKAVIARGHAENYGIYGNRRVHLRLSRVVVVAEGMPIARNTVRWLMTEMVLRGAVRSKTLDVYGQRRRR